MIALSPEQYPAVRPLFENLAHHLVVTSVLDGTTLGHVYADNLNHPRLALLWTGMDAVLVAGEPDEKLFPTLRHLVLEEMLPDARARYIPHFSITVDRPGWARRLPVLLPDRQLLAIPRLAFRLEKRRMDWRALLPPAMQLVPMDRSFFARPDLENMNGPAGWLHSFWPDEVAFVAHGLGFAVLDGTKAASWALSVYAGAGALELGVETAISHRGQGLATVAADACLEACISRDLTPQWQCDQNNVPSVRLATRLGFVAGYHYLDYRLPFSG